ncbi:hypothetical protein Fmac_018886 [Flemingia macrophylla]|uniref:Uncharacterized protein n=1 Tax=Flemingia macrophylla TaxID=520843 RepID=A0ABD1M676_9FABA
MFKCEDQWRLTTSLLSLSQELLAIETSNTFRSRNPPSSTTQVEVFQSTLTGAMISEEEFMRVLSLIWTAQIPN